MRVKLKAQITGTRNGEPWPDYGAEMDLPDEEAASMVAVGLAEAIEGKLAEPEPAKTRPLVPTRTMKAGRK